DEDDVRLHIRAEQAELFHRRLHETPLRFPVVELDAPLRIADDALSVGDGLHLQMGEMNLRVDGRYERAGADTLWSLALRIDTLQAAKALAALPAPAFARLRGMKLEGRFAFGMSADYRSSAPDSLRFSAGAYLKPLRIRSY